MIKRKFKIGVTLLLHSFLGFTHFMDSDVSSAKRDIFYKKVFPHLSRVKVISIKDTISDDPVNNKLLKVFSKKKFLGYIREIKTTTGCNSACLPVIYTSFYDEKARLIKILSRDGLTKINHTPFTAKDYSQLDFIVALAPKEFDHIKDPKELTDALSGATLKKYQPFVVKGAAYSTLRIHLYNLNTQNIITRLLKKQTK